MRLCALYTWITAALLVSRSAEAVLVGGDLSLTSNYIFRGISESNGRAAAQLDLHAGTADGTFVGAFASSLGPTFDGGAEYELEAYVGHRFDLSPAWSTTVSAVDYTYHHTHLPFSNDYQEISASLSYLDLWTISVAGAPNSVRYAGQYRLGRYPAYVADASGQLPLFGRLFAAAGVGYYSLTGPEGSAYVYGNAGLAVQYRAWRLDAGYYFVSDDARRVFPPGIAGNHFAATLSWHF
jgi:uncharacterized protein (TIGR02001 family)